MIAWQEKQNPAGGRGYEVHSIADGLHRNFSSFASLAVGDHRLPCPECARGPRDRALSVTVNPDGSYIAHCFRCGYIERTGQPTPYRPPQPARPKTRRATLSDWGRKLWAECQPIGGVARQYLDTRRCRIPPADGDLRWHPALKHPSGHVGPALVGLITRAKTGKALSLHRTWITATGKANVAPQKLFLADHDLADGVIRLWPDEAVTYGLGIAEGIETALSLAWAFKPVWCLMDAGHLAKFAPLPGIESLTIARDNDPAGIDAAYKCSAAWTAAGVEVFVTDQAENDLNDVAREGRA